MIKRFLIAPPYLQFFISDPAARNSPHQVERPTVISSGDCLSVLCQYADEGQTELIVGDFDEVADEGGLAYDGSIPTPNKVLWFADAELTELARVPVSTNVTRLRIFTDGLQFPERVVIGIAPG